MSAAFQASEAGRCLASAGVAKRREHVDAMTAQLRAGLPPRTVVPMTAEEARAVAALHVAMAEVALIRRELDFMTRFVCPREEAVAGANKRLRLAQSRVIAASEAVGIDILAVARGML